MPVSIVVGGQFGSEGKGKVSLEIARRSNEADVTLVRVGGPNSGHTAYTKDGRKFALRQLPAGCIDGDVDVVLPAGSYLDPEVLLSEIEQLGIPEDRLIISNFAQVITEEHKKWERDSGLLAGIGSTGSGVGAAVLARVARNASNFRLPSLEAQDAKSVMRIPGIVCDTTGLLTRKLARGGRVIVEGSQGFGLSLLDGGYWPKATARITSAAGALAESGLSPREVDDITLVLRSYPIRVAGASGPLVGEITWDELARKAGCNGDLREYTTVTKKLRRVGTFDPEIVKRAIAANNPSRIVLNHLDYVGPKADLTNKNSDLVRFISNIESRIGQMIDWYGFSGFDVDVASKYRGAVA